MFICVLPNSRQHLKVKSIEISERRHLACTAPATRRGRTSKIPSWVSRKRDFVFPPSTTDPPAVFQQPPRGFQIAAICRNKEKLIKINDSCAVNEARFYDQIPAEALAVYVHVFLFGNLGSAGTRRGAAR